MLNSFAVGPFSFRLLLVPFFTLLISLIIWKVTFVLLVLKGLLVLGLSVILVFFLHRLFVNAELVQNSSRLQTERMFLIKFKLLIEQNQRTELWLCIFDQELAVEELDFSVCPWNRNIRYSDIANVSSPDFQWSSFVSWDNVKASLFVSVVRIQRTRRVDAFDYNVLFVRFLDSHHFDFPVLHLYDLRERNLANFALKLVEIVTLHKALMLFLDFTVNPLFQTINMNDSAISFAFTWWNQQVLLSFLMTKANLASWHVSFALWFMVQLILPVRNLKNSLVTTDIFQVSWTSQRDELILSFQLCYNVLNPPKLNDVSWPQRVTLNIGSAFEEFFRDCERANYRIEDLDFWLFITKF